MSVKEELARVIEGLGDEDALRVMEFIVALRGEESFEPGDREALDTAAREGYEHWEQVKRDLGLDVPD
jgi:hypothetical protein